MVTTKNKRHGGTGPPANIPRQQYQKVKKVVLDWNDYFGPGDLSDWQRLMVDLGYTEYFKSKTQCRKALKNVWVNIVDFLEAVEMGNPPYKFENEQQLAKYTRATKKIYPKSAIQKGSPLESLLAYIMSPSKRYGK
ncbi:uncharacterized protein GGS25DRAFT_58638 [Hypoxylon fragiforme]|uniref:uncharacterized protein n=1 Tax=Hypoxylon fragiforme TaxID=63214 RepID=UPI0020C6F652|nr:uncharacterized protein GGS25DRAFT_58638 [Hypoxylon fragiforme]KAI2614620.1 hypothetical protein GGS25DRAFT_58638 [Hypoxylon fragiforme]